MNTNIENQAELLKIARLTREACLHAARESFIDASMNGLCSDGAMEAATGAIESIDLETIIRKIESGSDSPDLS